MWLRVRALFNMLYTNIIYMTRKHICRLFYIYTTHTPATNHISIGEVKCAKIQTTLKICELCCLKNDIIIIIIMTSKSSALCVCVLLLRKYAIAKSFLSFCAHTKKTNVFVQSKSCARTSNLNRSPPAIATYTTYRYNMHCIAQGSTIQKH